MLKIERLRVSIETKEILKGLNLEIGPNTVHSIMGPNGSGKSTLAQTLMGHPTYTVTEGQATFENNNILEMEPDQRSQTGLFLSFQYPSEIPGVTVSSYLRLIYNKSTKQNLAPVKFRTLLKEKMELLDMDESFMQRFLNEGFSGGEKKRMEMLQMLILEPKLAILDEVDSGLDIDALKVVSKAVNYLKNEKKTSFLIITHYARILHHIKPDFIHIMKDGVITKTGGMEVAQELEEKGYNEEN